MEGRYTVGRKKIEKAERLKLRKEITENRKKENGKRQI